MLREILSPALPATRTPTLAAAAAGIVLVAGARPLAAAQEADLAAFEPALAELAPEDRPHATLYARTEDGRQLVRRGSGVHICLGDEPGDERFSASCFHRGLDPLIGLELRLSADGLRGDELAAAVQAEIDAGRLAVPWGAYEVSVSAALDAGTGQPGELTVYHLVYTPGASTEEIGLPGDADGDRPYLHHAGRYDAHVMWTEKRPVR